MSCKIKFLSFISQNRFYFISIYLFFNVTGIALLDAVSIDELNRRNSLFVQFKKKKFFLNSCLDGYVQKTQTFKFWINTSPFFLSYTVKEKRAAKSKKCCKILQTLKTLTAMIKKLAAIFLTV